MEKSGFVYFCKKTFKNRLDGVDSFVCWGLYGFTTRAAALLAAGCFVLVYFAFVLTVCCWGFMWGVDWGFCSGWFFERILSCKIVIFLKKMGWQAFGSVLEARHRWSGALRRRGRMVSELFATWLVVWDFDGFDRLFFDNFIQKKEKRGRHCLRMVSSNRNYHTELWRTRFLIELCYLTLGLGFTWIWSWCVKYVLVNLSVTTVLALNW